MPSSIRRRRGRALAPVRSRLFPALALFLVVVFGIHAWLERPKNADLLIETEIELRKVTWPTSQEVFSSSLVVVVCVILLMAFLAGADWFLARVVSPVLF